MGAIKDMMKPNRRIRVAASPNKDTFSKGQARLFIWSIKRNIKPKMLNVSLMSLLNLLNMR